MFSLLHNTLSTTLEWLDIYHHGAQIVIMLYCLLESQKCYIELLMLSVYAVPFFMAQEELSMKFHLMWTNTVL